MSKNFYLMIRGWMDDDMWSDTVYSEREAFIYLIEKAAWKSRKFRVGNKIILLKRGQLTASIRYLAKAWKWKKDKVADFLKFMVEMKTIQTDIQTAQTVITICNYSKYQDISPYCQTDTRQIPDRYQTKQTNITNITNITKITKKSRARMVCHQNQF